VLDVAVPVEVRRDGTSPCGDAKEEDHARTRGVRLCERLRAGSGLVSVARHRLGDRGRGGDHSNPRHLRNGCKNINGRSTSCVKKKKRPIFPVAFIGLIRNEGLNLG
jgi:hypothetical protein